MTPVKCLKGLWYSSIGRNHSRVGTVRENKEAFVTDCFDINKTVFYYINFNKLCYLRFPTADIKVSFYPPQSTITENDKRQRGTPCVVRGQMRTSRLITTQVLLRGWYAFMIYLLTHCKQYLIMLLKEIPLYEKPSDCVPVCLVDTPF